MESKTNIEVEKGFENPKVDRDSQAEANNDQSTNVNDLAQTNDSNSDPSTELCEKHGYELATSDPLLSSNVSVGNDSNQTLEPAQSQQIVGSESKIANEPEETVAVSVVPEEALATCNNPDFTPINPIKPGTPEELCAMKMGELNAADEPATDDMIGTLKTSECDPSPSASQDAGQSTQENIGRLCQESYSDGLLPADNVNKPEEGTVESGDNPDFLLRDAKVDCEYSSSAASDASGNSDDPQIEEDPMSFLKRLNLKLSAWKDSEGVCPPEIEQIIQENDTEDIGVTSSQEPHPENSYAKGESEHTSEWQNMNYSEKMTFISFRQAGVPRKEAIAEINEARQERGMPVLATGKSFHNVQSEECTSADLDHPSTEKQALSMDKPKKLKLDLQGGERTTFKRLRALGLSRQNAWAKILESRAKSDSSVGEISVQAGSSRTADPSRAVPKARKVNPAKEARKLAKERKKELVQIFSAFTKSQKEMHLILRQDGTPHEHAVFKVIKMSEDLGIENKRLDNLLNALGLGTSTHSDTDPLKQTGNVTDVPRSAGGSGGSNCKQSADGSKNIVAPDPNDIEEYSRRYPEYGYFFLGLVRHPNCKHSLDEMIQMAEKIPEGHGLYGRQLFILRCYKFGVDPESWDWNQYSTIPPVPKILKIPPRQLVMECNTRRRQVTQPSCSHASCKYYSVPGGLPLEQHNRFQSKSIKEQNVGVSRDTFTPHQYDHQDSSGVQHSVIMGTPVPSSSVKNKNNYDLPRETKRSRFPEACSDDYHFAGTQPTPGKGTSSGDAVHLFVVPSGYPSERLDDEEMYEIENRIVEGISKIHDESMRPIFGSSFHSDGRYEVICQDQFSKEWLYKYVGSMSPSGSLIIIPAELEIPSVVHQSNSCQDHETRNCRDLYEPRYASGSGSISQERCPRERSVFADRLQHDYPSSSKRNLQERLGPKIKSPEYGGSQYIEPSTLVSIQGMGEAMGSRNVFPDYTGHGEPSQYTDPSWDIRSNSPLRNPQERLVEVTRSPSPEYYRSRYITPSVHDESRREMDDSRRSYSDDYVEYEHSGSIESSGYVQPSCSYQDPLAGYNPNFVVTRSHSPEYSRSGYSQQPLHGESRHGIDRSTWRRYSSDHMDYEEPSTYGEPSSDEETPSTNYYHEQSDHHPRRIASPEHRSSRNHLGYYDSPGHDPNHRTHSPSESGLSSRSDARERLMRIRSNRTPGNYVERDRSPPDAYSSRTVHQERFRSPPPSSESARKTDRSKYGPSRQHPPSFSKHFSKNL